jgi:hypothetical protein
VDAEAAALEGGLHGRLYGERHGGGGGLSLRSCGWRGADGGGSWCWRRFGYGNSQIAVRRPNSEITSDQVLGSGARIFLGESSAPLAPTAMMSVGVVTLMGASLWLSFPFYGSW